MSEQELIEQKQLSPIKKLRIKSGMSQAELAKMIPDKSGLKTISQRAVSAWERREYDPELTIPQTKALCQALGVSFEQLAEYYACSERSAEMVH